MEINTPCAQRGAEGRDALQIVIKAFMAVPDLEGCGPSQPWKPIETPTIDTYFASRPNKAPIAQRGAEGTDALQILKKASMVVPDLEGHAGAGNAMRA